MAITLGTGIITTKNLKEDLILFAASFDEDNSGEEYVDEDVEAKGFKTNVDYFAHQALNTEGETLDKISKFMEYLTNHWQVMSDDVIQEVLKIDEDTFVAVFATDGE